MAANSVTAFMDDPMGYFDRSVTKMHNLPRASWCAAADRHGASLRTTRARIEIVHKLAERLA